MSLDRARAWRLFGEPTDQEGSVNDPRTREAFGVRYNEKWSYLDEDGKRALRVVLWNRYDLAGVFRLTPDGKVEPEAIPEG